MMEAWKEGGLILELPGADVGTFVTMLMLLTGVVKYLLLC